jgi:TatD-related deoxyribonuclease
MDYTDNHMHIDPLAGEGIGAVKKFERVGGRYILLVNKMTRDWGLGLKGVGEFETLYQKTIELAREIESRTPVRVFPVLGIHPAEFVHMCETFGMKRAMDIGKGAIKTVKVLVEEGMAHAIGEVGRPHFPVGDEYLEACNELTRFAMEKAAEVDCAIQLHTESIEEGVFEEFAAMAKEAGLRPERVVKHYSPPFISQGETTGIFPSLIASKGNILTALKDGRRFLMESDYIDDLRRPGAVVGPRSVPRVSKYLLEAGLISEADLEKIHIDNVERVYRIELG